MYRKGYKWVVNKGHQADLSKVKVKTNACSKLAPDPSAVV